MTASEFMYNIGITFPEKLYDLVVACSGTEEPIRYQNGRTLLYVFNVRTHCHGFLDEQGMVWEDINQSYDSVA